MKPKREIFRKVALERLSSPEQLDQLVQVTSPASWLALAGILLLLGAAGAWSVYGSIPTEATGEGVLLRQSGVSDLVSTGAGQVEEVLVAVGDEVQPGQVVARVRQEPLLRQIETTRSQISELEEEYRGVEGDLLRQRRLQGEDLERRRSSLDNGIDSLGRELAILDRRLEVERDLLADGLVTRQTVLDSEREINAVRERLSARRLEREALELERVEAERGFDQQLEERRRQIRAAARELVELEAQLEEDTRVVSPYAGRVLELAVEAGDVVSPGTPLLSVEEPSEELVAVLFVPAEQSRRVEPGMTARISPSTVRREEHGFLVGEVRWVASFPSTERGMLRLLANQALVQRLSQSGPLLRVDITLKKDPDSPSGYRWSSSEGPDFPITSGTFATGGVVVREDPPIALAIPALKETLKL